MGFKHISKTNRFLIRHIGAPQWNGSFEWNYDKPLDFEIHYFQTKPYPTSIVMWAFSFANRNWNGQLCSKEMDLT